MSTSIYREYRLGDMLARYMLDDETKNVELLLLPAGMEPPAWSAKKQTAENLVQVHLTGDSYPGGYAGGGTLRQGESSVRLQLTEQKENALPSGREIATSLKDSRGYLAVHHLIWLGGQSLRSWVEWTNQSAAAVSIEMLSSFSLGGLTPYTPGDAHDALRIHRVRSVWSMEGRLQSQTAEQLQLEPSWAGHAVRCERFGQVGSIPVNHWFPWVFVEDTKNKVFWGAQIAHNASWQMELYRKDDGLSLSGGLADRDFGQWLKTVAPNETFRTPEAILTVCRAADVDEAAQRLTTALEPELDAGPECEQNLPILFNEYCTTWGCPSQENIAEILKAIRGKGFSYFVIDCGWYKEDGIPWDVDMGDYQVSDTLFPDGLDHTVDAIKREGLIPGIWFEIDNVGCRSRAYQMEAHLLQKDGVTLTTTMRRFWDMRQPWVQQYLTEKVIRRLQKYGFGYVKMDYNDTIGPGCDGAESLGEGLRQNMEASFAFIQKMKEAVPGLIVENCASGGHKLEPKMLAATAMSSFSDAHECEEIPIIAANLHRVMLPRQSQIWAVIRKTDSPKRIAYSITNTFLGRMCLSGDVTDLSAAQWKLIDDGIAFYKKAASLLKKGRTARFGPEIGSYRHPEGWQCVLRQGENGDALAVFHFFNGVLPAKVEIPMPKEYSAALCYSAMDIPFQLAQNTLTVMPTENMSSLAIYLKKKGDSSASCGQ